MDLPKEVPKTEKKESGLSFKFAPIKEIPRRAYRKGSKYDPVIEGFLKSNHAIAKVEIEGKDANYIRTQLTKRLDADTKLRKKIEVSVINNICYLSRIKS